jgi:hypothetical protein
MGSFTTTYPNDEYLHKTFIANAIKTYMTSDLIAPQEAKFRDVGDASSVQWIEELYSDYGDVLRISSADEVKLRDSSLFPHVKFSHFDVKTDVLHKYGIEMDFSEECRKNTSLVDYIDRGISRGAYWLATLLNTVVFNSMTNSWSTTAATEANDEPWNYSAPNVWSDTTNRTPLEDVQALKLLVEDTQNYNYELDRAYLRKDNFHELQHYLRTANGTAFDWLLDPKSGRWNGMLDGIKFMQVHKLAGVQASTGLFLSRNVKPTTIYTRKDSQYAIPNLKDNSGNALPFPFHVHRYFTDEDHDTHIQIWVEMAVVTDRWGRKSVGLLDTL